MESLVKDISLLKRDYVKNNPLVRTPKGFVESFDRWRDTEGKKNNIEISRSDGFKAIEKIIPFLSLDITTSGLVKRKQKEINLRIK